MSRTLDLYKTRKHSTITLSNKVTYKIPNEYLVEEMERLLEMQIEREAIEKEEVTDKLKQLEKFWAIVFDQLEIIFQHYQDDVTADFLKTVVTHNEALEIVGFFQEYRHSAIKEINKETASKKEESKKKDKLASEELRDIRRIVIFMVTNGFSLYELRKLYGDELYSYYDELIYNLEKSGKLKEGVYAKLVKSGGTANAKDTVNSLRKQMFKTIADKNKKS